MTREPTSSELRRLRERRRAILRGDLELNSPDIPLASAEEWAEIGLSEPRTYASFNPLGVSTQKQPKPSEKKSPPPPEN